MKSRLLSKCFLTLGLLLFLTLLMPLTKASAASIDNEKNDSYRLNLKSITLVKGKSFPLKVYNLGENAKVLFKSDNPDIASITEDSGIISANKVGTAVVTVTIKDGAYPVSLTCDVTVGLPAFSVKLTKSRIILGVDKSDYLSVILKPINTIETAKFSIKDYNIASVSANGRITAKKAGLTYAFAEIDATNVDGTPRYSRCTVIVTSSEDAPKLEEYFNSHPEFDFINDDELNKALDEYFNTKYDPTSSTALDKSLNKFLDDKFNLANYKAQRDAALAKMLNQTDY